MSDISTTFTNGTIVTADILNEVKTAVNSKTEETLFIPPVTDLFADVPAAIKVATDREFNVWYHSLVFNLEKSGLIIESEYTGSGKNDLEDCFRHTPAATTSYTLTFKAYNMDRTLYDSKMVTVTVVAKNAGSGTKNVLFIGDSLLATETVIEAFDTLVSGGGGATVNYLGGHGPGADTGTGVRHEAISGWSLTDFSTNTAIRLLYTFTVSGISVEPQLGSTQYTQNGSTYTVVKKLLTAGAGTLYCERTGATTPNASGTLTKVGGSGNGDATITYSATSTTPGNAFWDASNSRLDFQQYLTTWGGGATTIDYCFIQLGINDILGASAIKTGAEIITIKNKLTTILDALVSVTYGYPSCKIIISLPPVGSLYKDGFAAALAGSRDIFERNIRLLNAAYVTAYDAAAYDSDVTICPTFLWVDRKYGYNFTTTTRSQRVTDAGETVTYFVGSEYVHPKTSGRYQEADALYSHFKSLV
jgi:lysophospholipase L1-like esterase